WKSTGTNGVIPSGTKTNRSEHGGNGIGAQAPPRGWSRGRRKGTLPRARFQAVDGAPRLRVGFAVDAAIRLRRVLHWDPPLPAAAKNSSTKVLRRGTARLR